MNRVEISGHLTRDPDLRYVGENFPICNLNIAVHDDGGRFNRDTKRTETESGFYQVEVKGDYGAYIQSILERGDEVHVVGSLSQWRTQAREGKESETKTRITAKVVTALTPPRTRRQPIEPPVDPLADDPVATQQTGGWGQP